jgi:succinate-semialdehyde dehydrogenase/glutarate-semialdehyde dehydrogenase
MNEFSTSNPSTSQSLKTYRYSSAHEIEKALEVLSRGARQPLSAVQKRDRLERFAQALTSKKQELGRLITVEMGKPLKDAIAEVEKSVTAVEYALQNFEKEFADESIKTKDTQFTVRKERLGIVFAVMPWNFPIWQILRVLPMSFAAGNPVLLKHSDLVAGTAGFLGELAAETLGAEYFQNLYLNHDQAAQVIADNRVRAVTMTGSAKGGREIAAQAGRSLKKVVLELGGSDPYLVFADADVPAAAKLCAQTRLLNNGQSCISGKRFLVHENIYEQFVADFCHELGQFKVGDPMQAATKLGPLAHAKFKTGLQKQIEQLQAQGGQKIFEAPLALENDFKAGAFVAPQVFAVSGLEPVVTQDEFFGPVALMMKFKSEDHAVQLANASVYGLGGGVFSKDLEVCGRVSDRLDCGFVAWNDFVRSHPAAPFGGVKDSGFGRELGVHGFREFLNLKTLSRRL